MKRIFVAVLTVGLLASCSSTASDEEEVNPRDVFRATLIQMDPDYFRTVEAADAWSTAQEVCQLEDEGYSAGKIASGLINAGGFPDQAAYDFIKVSEAQVC